MPLKDMEIVEISDKMSEEDIKKAEEYLKNGEDKLRKLFKTQEDWEKNGIDLTEVSEGARSDIEKLTEKAWLRMRRRETKELQKDIKSAKAKLEKAKKKLAKIKSKQGQA